MNPVAASKYLSYLLRHHPGGLDMDRHGYASVERVLRKLRQRFPDLTPWRLQQLVDDSDRQRFEIRDDNIRARYGHSVPVDIQWPSADDLETLYHGTTEEAAASILRQGLQSRGRQMVHLSATREDARRAGRRHGQPVVLHIDAEAARRRDVTFYQATDSVILAAYVPPAVISRIG